MSDRDRSVANPGRTEIERVRAEHIEIKNVGTTAKIRDEVHAHTNHYIKQSKPYFPNDKLLTYIDCPYFLRVARWLCFASLFGALVAAGASKFIPVSFLVACLLFFLFYCQHEWVNQKTLPVVHKQPFIPDQKLLNTFYEVTITELDGIALQNYQAGIGFVELSQGKIKFQAFNNTAKKDMSDAKCQSRLMLLLFLAASVYNCYFVAAY